MNPRQTKLAIIATFIIVAVLIAIYVISTSISRSGKTAVSFNVFPNNAQVAINGKSIGSGRQYLTSGSYTVKATSDGFEDYSKDIVVGEIERNVIIAMTPVSDKAKQWVKDHEAEYDKLEGLAEKDNYETGKYFHTINPIAKDLPYRTFMYTIGYRMDQSDPTGNSIIIEIDASEAYRQAALYRIRQLGYDPTDFTINFRDYENPFPL